MSKLCASRVAVEEGECHAVVLWLDYDLCPDASPRRTVHPRPNRPPFLHACKISHKSSCFNAGTTIHSMTPTGAGVKVPSVTASACRAPWAFVTWDPTCCTMMGKRYAR